MGKVSAETVLAMPRTEAWAKLRNLELAQNYVPGVSRVEVQTPMREGVGASRKVFYKGQPRLDETVTHWEDGHGYTLKLHNGDGPPSPFKSARFIYFLDDASGGETRLQATLAYELPLGPVGRLFDALLMRPIAARTVRTIARGLKHFYETGTSAN